MSSILKALKKLEKQAGDQSPVGLWQQNNHVQKTHQKHMDENVRFGLRYFIISVGLIFAVGAGMFLSQKIRERKPEPATQKEARLQKTTPLAEKKAALSGNLQKEPPIRLDTKNSESIQKTAPVFSPKPGENAAVSINQEFPRPERTREETIAERRLEKPVQKTTADRFASIPVMQSNETKIELQAIAWSRDPKNRLAVINGLVLREGESIDNAIVMHIGKDEIILRKEGAEWKQLFGF